jgi:hypothetical protein
VSHAGDVVVGEEPLRKARIILVVQPSGKRLPLAKRQPDIDGGEEAASVLAEGGRKLGGGTLLLDEVVRAPDARAVKLVSRLPDEHKKYAPLAVDEGLWVTASRLA